MSDVGVHRFFGLGPFALIKGVPVEDLMRWRHRIWVPEPDVVVGTRSGWSLPCIEHFTPFGEPFPRAPIRFYDDLAAMVRRYDLTGDALWADVVAGNIVKPTVWVDDHPGWEKE